ncbi:RNA-binding protein Bicaudal-C [Heracleum sosnowskyi]|uniref:RNA-binding protein Bicaudal-C n=1 Tax=Heracleum sosnowskyi TaxID=360622 RepID=A0AAD8GQ79_9APIA|nr:RNA-binding protein Bicaudal-C [Heracleum sosnowskyi]
MYADREAGAAKVSIKDRLNIDDSGRRRRISGKRQRQDDDKWEHDLYDRNDPQVSSSRVGATDLRLKLQKRTIQKATHTGNGSAHIRDLREKLSGTVYSQPAEAARAKPRAVTEGTKPVRKSVVPEASVPETKKVNNTVSKKKAEQKLESVDSFLFSLGLEKYSKKFNAEEVDMTALLHMNDEDLKAMSIPMGPRKKILLALDSKV